MTKTVTMATWKSWTIVAEPTRTTGQVRTDGDNRWEWVASGKRVDVRRVIGKSKWRHAFVSDIASAEGCSVSECACEVCGDPFDPDDVAYYSALVVDDPIFCGIACGSEYYKQDRNILEVK